MPAAPSPLPSQSAAKVRVVSGVIRGLLHGRWHGGERLTEASVAELFSVSRTPVREGLLELAALGMVQLRRNCGAVLQPFGPRQLSEIYSVRALLEVEAASLAAGRVPAASVESLLLGFETLRRDGLPDEGWKLDRQLHTTLASHSGNARLAEEIGRYTLLVQTMREAVGESLADIQTTSIAEHIEILLCVGRGDSAGSGLAMRKHLLQAEQSALSTMRALNHESPQGKGSPSNALNTAHSGLSPRGAPPRHRQDTRIRNGRRSH
jgi:DNA-binding GntR family transcriptional regulator